MRGRCSGFGGLSEAGGLGVVIAASRDSLLLSICCFLSCVGERCMSKAVASMRRLRQRVHDHYLKGLFCGRCHRAGREHRLIYMRVRGRGGEHYEYFGCRGRQEHCDLPHLAVHRVEEAIAHEYARAARGR